MPTISDEHRYPCEQCGAELRFAPGQSVLKCDHCGHVQTIAPADADPTDGPWAARTVKPFQEHDLASGLRDDLPATASEQVRATHCPNCGAMVEFQGANHATECPFCATPLVIDSGSHRMIKPQALIPFQLDEPGARKALVAWLGSLWFAPNRLLEFTRAGRAMNGAYVPYWTFDADTRSRYRGARGVYYYETRTVTVNVNGRSERRQEQVRKTRWSPASGTVARRFDDVLVIASTSLPTGLGDGLEPWDLSGLQPYNPDYLAGLQAEGYTVPLVDGHQTGRAKMDRVIYADVCHDIGGDEQRVDDIDSDYRAETFKHILLPVWMAAYKYSGKSYRFLVNGQTGEVQGERPWSVWKITFAVIGALIVAGALTYVYYLNNPGAFQ
ncbi:MAG: primosomal protein N' (replication factor Y) - superfamily II helicase [Candidatus Saccharibacteria bacterium]|nr:primosomal protein N' (replication factor Y) - superfamily II helicase [Pseudorhodobacter sp.]